MSTESQGDDISPRVDMSHSYRGINAHMAEVKQKRTGRCLLALDGGGIRGFSQIEILHEISSRIKHDQGLDQWPCLCDYFDMIGGVGTGGYIAILVGRLALITPVIKDEFMVLLSHVLVGPMEVVQLDDWLKELVRRYTGDPETLMFDPTSPTNHCKTFVGTNTAGNISYQTKFRSYGAREGPNFNPPIWQVLRATLAHPTLFPGIKIGPDLIHQVYISGEFGWNNPSIEVIKEFESQWKRQSIACLANIGTGHGGVIQIEEINGSIVPATLNGTLERMATDCERIVDEVTNRFQGQSSYHRLSVEHGLDRGNHDKPVTLEDVVTQTNSYLRSSRVSLSVDALVGSLLYPFEFLLWPLTRDGFEETLDSYILKAKERVDKLQTVGIKSAAREVVVTFEIIRNTTSNEEHWLKLVKAIDNQFDLITQNAMLKLREPVLSLPLRDSIKDYVMELSNVHRSVKSLLNLNAHQIWGPPTLEPFLTKCLTNLGECFKRMKGILKNDIQNRLHQWDQDKELEKLLAWLSPLEPQRRHEDVRAKRTKGTGSWFLNTPEIQTWCNNESPRGCHALCSFGEPGAGKTMMCSSIIDYLREKHSGQPEVGIAFLYCDYRDAENQTGPKMIGALTKQLMWQAQSIPQTVWEVFGTKNKAREAVDSEVAERLFTLILHEFKVAYICIDALDEYEHQLRIQLLRLFKTLSQTSLRIFLTGRQSVEAEVADALATPTFENVPIAANEGDIRMCVSQRIANDPYPEAMDEKLKDEIIEKIIGLSQGTFLLPVLQIQTVLEHDTKRDRRLALSNIPSELFDTYTDTFERIKRQPGTRPQRGLAVLTWVYLAQRQLRLVELQQALAVKPGDVAFDVDGLPSNKALVDCCLGLVVIEAKTSTIRLTHFTLQEYLDEHWTDLFPLGHATIAATCVTYLNFKHQFKVHGETPWESQLINYVACNAGHHLKMGSNTTLDEQFIAILSREDKFRLLEDYFRDLLIRTSYPYTTITTSPLHWAAYFGATSIMKLLLESVDVLAVNAQDIPCGRTPLSYAAEYGHKEAAQLLVGVVGVDINLRDQYQWTPLFYAAQSNYEEVVQLLLDTPGIDANPRDVRRRAPLSYAAEHGCERVVRLLLGTPSVDINPRDQYQRTPLSYAIESRHEGVVQLLVDATDIDVNAKDQYQRTPLSYAAQYGHEGMVQRLLGTPGVDISSRDEYQRTPLLHAASNGHEGVTQLLSSVSGIDINSRDKSGRTPLSYVAQNGCEGAVRLLVGIPEVHVNLGDQYQRTPLSYAANYGHKKVVQLLVGVPAVDVDSRDIHRRTPLSYAAEQDYQAVVQLLLSTSGVDGDSKDVHQRTPLSYAAQNGYEGVVQMLVGTPGVDVNSRDKDKQTPLLYAALNGHEGVVRLLVGMPDVDVNSRNIYERTPLSYAAEWNHEGVVQLLVGLSGVIVDSRDKYQRTPLSHAASNGCKGVVRLLVGTSGVDVDSKDESEWTPLSYAARNCHEEVVQLLLDHGAIDNRPSPL